MFDESGFNFVFLRTIYVPQDKSASLPKIFDVDVGTSFGYNKLKKSRFPSFSSEDRYSYNNPITSYDAPIAPSSKKLESEEKKSLKKIRKVKKEKVPTSDSEQYGKVLIHQSSNVTQIVQLQVLG